MRQCSVFALKANPNVNPNIEHGLRRIVTNTSEHIVEEINYNSMGFAQLRTIMDDGFGGEAGIRTLGTLAGTPHFECGAFDHSATSP